MSQCPAAWLEQSISPSAAGCRPNFQVPVCRSSTKPMGLRCITLPTSPATRLLLGKVSSVRSDSELFQHQKQVKVLFVGCCLQGAGVTDPQKLPQPPVADPAGRRDPHANPAAPASAAGARGRRSEPSAGCSAIPVKPRCRSCLAVLAELKQTCSRAPAPLGGQKDIRQSCCRREMCQEMHLGLRV